MKINIDYRIYISTMRITVFDSKKQTDKSHLYNRHLSISTSESLKKI